MSRGLALFWLILPRIRSISNTSSRTVRTFFSKRLFFINPSTISKRSLSFSILVSGWDNHCFNKRPPPLVTVSSNKSTSVPWVPCVAKDLNTSKLRMVNPSSPIMPSSAIGVKVVMWDKEPFRAFFTW